MKEKTYKSVIIGCNLLFAATEDTAKYCLECDLQRGVGDCLTDIMAPERHYLYASEDLEQALAYVGPVAYRLGWNVNQTIKALNYFTQAKIPTLRAGTSLRRVICTLGVIGSRYEATNPRTHTFSEILDTFSELLETVSLSKEDYESQLHLGEDFWNVLNVYQETRKQEINYGRV